MSSSLPSLPVQIIFTTCGNYEPAVNASGICCREEPGADALCGPGGYDKITLRTDSQEVSTRNRMSEDNASKSKPSKKTLITQSSIKVNNSKVTVREYQRQARDAVNQIVQEPSDRYEVLMMQEIPSVQNGYQGQMGENERGVAHMIGSEAREALRGQRNQMLR